MSTSSYGAGVFIRNGHDWAKRFKKIANDAFLISASSAIIDGDVVVPAADGTTDFSMLQNQFRGKSHKIVMVAFDLNDAFGLVGMGVETAGKLSIPAHLHRAVMQLPPEQRRDRATVNEVVRPADRDGQE